VRIIHQVNRGKAAALNLAMSQADTEIVVTIDADTEIESDAISKLVRHFSNPTVGAVAGNVKGWQSLPLAHPRASASNTSPVRTWKSVPSICSIASRSFPGRSAHGAKKAIEARRRHHSGTPWQKTPTSPSPFAASAGASATTRKPIAGPKRRILPAISFASGSLDLRHAASLLGSTATRFLRPKHGTLGWIALPNIFIFQLVLPLISPVIDLMFLRLSASLGTSADSDHAPPAALDHGRRRKIPLLFVGFVLIDILTCMVAFALERKEDWTLLFPVLLQRFYYRQLMYVVLFRSVKEAVSGRPVGWRGVERDIPPPPPKAPPRPAPAEGN